MGARPAFLKGFGLEEETGLFYYMFIICGPSSRTGLMYNIYQQGDFSSTREEPCRCGGAHGLSSKPWAMEGSPSAGLACHDDLHALEKSLNSLSLSPVKWW